MMNHAAPLAGLFKAVLIVGAIPATYLLARRKTASQTTEPKPTDAEEIVGSLDDLERAEREVAKTEEQRKASLGEGFEIIAAFSTRQGFNERDIRAIVSSLHRQKFQAKFIFKDLSSSRDVRSMRMNGIWEILVPKSQVKDARTALDRTIDA